MRQKNDNETKKIKKIRTHQERWVGVGWEAKSDSEKKSSSPSHRCREKISISQMLAGTKWLIRAKEMWVS